MKRSTVKRVGKALAVTGIAVFLIGLLLVSVPSTKWLDAWDRRCLGEVVSSEDLDVEVPVTVFPLREQGALVLVVSNTLMIAGWVLYAYPSRIETGDIGVYCNACGELVPSNSIRCRYCGHGLGAPERDRKDEGV